MKLSNSAPTKCQAVNCPQRPILQVGNFADGAYVSAEYLCNLHAQKYMTLAALTHTPPSGRMGTEADTVSMQLRSIAYVEASEATLIILADKGGQYLFLLPADYFTAAAISQSLQSAARPGSHHAMAMLVEACGGSLQQVIVKECDSTGAYHAIASIKTPIGMRKVDMRPSDALALSQVCRVPFLVSVTLLHKYSVD